MAYIIADNILSPLGNDANENLNAIRQGHSALRPYAASTLGVGHDFVSSIMEHNEVIDNENAPTRFEQKVLASVWAALRDVPEDVDIRSPRTLLILSTTKGHIESMRLDTPADQMQIGRVAERIAQRLGITTKPIVVCNACISGLSALILAERMIDQGQYDHAIVCGTDDIGRFVVSGFQSLNALSAQECRPFDIERSGLNLGEAVATLILTNTPQPDCWQIEQGVVRNDAYHISAPSKQAEGQYECLRQLLAHVNPATIDFINLHGTATLFNDQMESVAIERAGLSSVPVNAYKGYYGHTLGAAGVLEVVLSLHAIAEGYVLATRGFDELGVSGKVNISNQERDCWGHCFVKTLSGFGGCNAAALFSDWDNSKASQPYAFPLTQLTPTHRVVITPDSATLDGAVVQDNDHGASPFLVQLYKAHVGDYPKFYKMDALSRLGFLAAEFLVNAEQKENAECKPLVKAEGENVVTDAESRAVVFFNAHSSLAADRKYLESIADSDNYFPSPAAFVYTLPNIVTGEVAIRHGYHGETSFYILPDRDESVMQQVLQATTADGHLQSIIAGWVDYVDADHFLADVAVYEIAG